MSKHEKKENNYSDWVTNNNTGRISRVEDKIEKLDERFVTRYEFDPIKKGFYGLVSIILVAVIGAVISLVLK